MIDISKVTELIVCIRNRPTELASVMSTLAIVHVKLRALCSQLNAHHTTLLLLPEPVETAAAALRVAGFEVETESVVLISAPPEPLLATYLGQRLVEAGLGLRYTFTSWRGVKMNVVFKTTDDDEAVRQLTVEEFRSGRTHQRPASPQSLPASWRGHSLVT